MAVEGERQKIVVVGAGPVGALAAIYAAQRGHDVEIYELRSDLRDPSTTPLNFSRSINLALSERGINAMRHSGRTDLLEKVLSETIPMRGRMIHSKTLSGEFIEQSQDYDIYGRALHAADRGSLNKTLLDELETMPNVKFFFSHKLTGADFKACKAWFEISHSESSKDTTGTRAREVEIEFDLMIGADGAHSAVRYHLMKYARLDYEQTYIDTLWCEFSIEAKEVQGSGDPSDKFAISPNHLHIWPGKDFMFIAIPSSDGSFTCTLFLPSSHFSVLEATPSTIPSFFDAHFPGVTSIIPPSSLIQSFTTNPHLPLISIKCQPYHYGSSVVIIGDAAHAMVPFYGQGMNAGLEDVFVLFSILDSHSPSPSSLVSTYSLGHALATYSTHRRPDAHAINDLALQNYTEMRASVISPLYKARKYLEEHLSIWLPGLGWRTKYSRVSFGNERYREVVRSDERQGRLLMSLLGGLSVGGLGGLIGLGIWGLRLVRGRRGGEF
ncbi:kynurenine 3-monooxygenase, mitochondrial precursor [Cadophora gregata]|uniref:kynurenine 3-monooxygenase, mitochondrial precursor n=1 Tax=Cadophora gregata TaxID=51156 RepID=UPI0026DC6004|nr:kynurenine 3-monooxygenase, mitochondrial precursor [Cadophora gregata]KAK0118469.1 kynurenine 3-monooxygenase, mitochondrial precursor [Cadophora gregata]KAK0123539.1 kynurenine 3-monooxygenase, mitochondrial precursor [Cadophora gregata f. sp. sojae]